MGHHDQKLRGFIYEEYNKPAHLEEDGVQTQPQSAPVATLYNVIGKLESREKMGPVVRGCMCVPPGKNKGCTWINEVSRGPGKLLQAPDCGEGMQSLRYKRLNQRYKEASTGKMQRGTVSPEN
jgi:hypothetical protein